MRTATTDVLFPAAILMAVGLWSVIRPYDMLTWGLEAAPVIVIFCIVITVCRRFPFTPLSYWLLALGGIAVLIGAHYTYARMPLFEWVKEEFALGRNHYDRFGHFLQGTVPAIVFRELLLRTSPLRRGAWLFFIVVALCLAKSVLYEFAEWWTTILMGEKAHDFLAMQGDEWDAQKDMFWAAAGSIVSLLVLSRLHDRQLARFGHR